MKLTTRYEFRSMEDCEVLLAGEVGVMQPLGRSIALQATGVRQEECGPAC